MRIHIYFAKTEAMRYTGHLDLQRTWERTLRRARLPLAYSQGFKPHPRINLPAALPLGFTSQAEIAEVWLEGEQSLESVEAALRPALPPGLEILEIRVEAENAPKLQNRILSAEYSVTLQDPPADLEQRVARLLEANSVPRQRRGKDYDLRPLIEALTLEAPDRLNVHLTARPGATGRPDEVVLALGLDPHRARFHRKALILEEDEA